MKKINFKIKPEVGVTIGLLALSVVQSVLTNKKEAAERTALKEELKSELMKDMLKNQD